MRWFLVCLLALGPILPLRADDLLPQVQQKLRAQRFYFGEIDGRASAETVRAIKKFQTAKAIDATGNLDYDTVRALGLSSMLGPLPDEVRRLNASGDTILRYLQARETRQWSKVRDFYAPNVNFLYDGILDRAAIERIHAAEDRRWPLRQLTLLNRIAAPLGRDQAQVTTRIRCEVGREGEARQARTEDLIFRLQQSGDRWEITALKLLE